MKHKKVSKTAFCLSKYLGNGQGMFGCHGPNESCSQTGDRSGTSSMSSLAASSRAQVFFPLGLVCIPGTSCKTSSFTKRKL